jgi:hypothetical protein
MTIFVEGRARFAQDDDVFEVGNVFEVDKWFEGRLFGSLNNVRERIHPEWVW